MRALPSTGLFQQPELSSIKKEDTAQDFVLNVGIAGVPQAPTSGLMNPAEMSASQATATATAASQVASQTNENSSPAPASAAQPTAPAN